MNRPHLSNTSDATQIPAWVPADLREIYRLIAGGAGGEHAASTVRRLKRDPRASWTYEHVLILVRDWALGRSAGATAKALGTPFTRNSVIGKRSRLGLFSLKEKAVQTRDGSSVVRPKAIGTKRPTAVRPNLVVVSPAPAAAPSFVTPVTTVAEPPAASTEGGIELLSLKRFHCRFVVADGPAPGRDGPPARFCGARTPPDGNSSWCTEHAARVFVRGRK